MVKSYSILPIYWQHIMKKALFLHFLRSRLITYLITSSLGVNCFGKSLEKVLDFGSKNLYEPWVRVRSKMIIRRVCEFFFSWSLFPKRVCLSFSLLQANVTHMEDFMVKSFSHVSKIIKIVSCSSATSAESVNIKSLAGNKDNLL